MEKRELSFHFTVEERRPRRQARTLDTVGEPLHQKVGRHPCLGTSKSYAQNQTFYISNCLMVSQDQTVSVSVKNLYKLFWHQRGSLAENCSSRKY